MIKNNTSNMWEIIFYIINPEPLFFSPIIYQLSLYCQSVEMRKCMISIG